MTGPGGCGRLLQASIETHGKIHSRWIMLAGLIAVIAGLWMAQLIHRMMDDTGLMRQGVAAMSNDMGSMSHPFRVINNLTHW